MRRRRAVRTWNHVSQREFALERQLIDIRWPAKKSKTMTPYDIVC